MFANKGVLRSLGQAAFLRASSHTPAQRAAQVRWTLPSPGVPSPDDSAHGIYELPPLYHSHDKLTSLNEALFGPHFEMGVV